MEVLITTLYFLLMEAISRLDIFELLKNDAYKTSFLA